MAMTETSLSVSVVVAAWPDATGLADCLGSLRPQAGEGVQIFVVSPAAAPADFARHFPAVRWLTADPAALIPRLWSLGMAAATGEVVAITTAHFVPAADWIAQIRAAYQRLDSAGIAGPIDPPLGGSLGDWATYFLRYSTAFIYDREQSVHDLIGDNAAYRRSDLQRHGESIRAGFWEPEFHRLVLAEGRKLTFVPEMRITQKHSFGIARFCSQRLHHGRQYGGDRMRGKSALYRAAGIMLSPLIPLVLLAKIMGRLSHRPAYVPPFLASLPVLLFFLCSWALGELQGYLGGVAPTGPDLAAPNNISA
jgi:hypothetical protein